MRWWAPALVLFILGLASACGDSATAPPAAPTETTSAVVPTPSGTPIPAAPSPPDPDEGTVTVLGGGDVMLGRTVGDGIVANGPIWPFERIVEILRAADITFVNLESPLSDRGEAARKDFVFRGPPEAARGLADAGIDIVTTANNHMLDYGLAGLRDTWANLESAGVLQVGSGENATQAHSPVIVEANGLRIAFLGYVNVPREGFSGFSTADTQATDTAPGVAWLSPEAVAQDVADAKQEADHVIVAFQAGAEYSERPIALQVQAAHAAVDAGASVVFGHHPHVLQEIETFKGGLIIYSLGNLVFDFDSLDYSYAGLPSALTGMLKVGLRKDGVVSCEFIPMLVAEVDGRPRPVEGEEAERVLERMRRLSDGSCGL